MNNTEINSIKQAYDVLQSADAKTLVIFDCDDTLLMPADKLVQEGFRETETFRNLWTSWHERFSVHSYINSGQDVCEELISSRICMNARYELVERAMHDEIQALQKRSIKTIALTAQFTGKYGEIERFEQWRFEKLGLLGIKFNSSFVEQEIKLDALASYKNNYPIFYQGILCANTVPKGDVLGAFLDRIEWQPERVIFFDDSKKYVDSVAQEMEKRAISFYGYVYKAASLVSVTIDFDIARFQLEYLKKYQKWIGDDQALSMMRKEKFEERIQKSVSP